MANRIPILPDAAMLTARRARVQPTVHVKLGLILVFKHLSHTNHGVNKDWYYNSIAEARSNQLLNI
jgi:hypothetical protein